jgi:hypothetical protein
MAAPVELHAAFEWTCDLCGRSHFARAVTLEDQQVEELVSREDREEAEALMEVIDSLGTGWFIKPATVRCPDCDVEFNVARDDP